MTSHDDHRRELRFPARPARRLAAGALAALGLLPATLAGLAALPGSASPLALLAGVCATATGLSWALWLVGRDLAVLDDEALWLGTALGTREIPLARVAAVERQAGPGLRGAGLALRDRDGAVLARVVLSRFRDGDALEAALRRRTGT